MNYYTKPQTLTEYVGQPKAKRLVEIMVLAAQKKSQPLPNVLISGPFGQGKTALAVIMAKMYRPGIQLIDSARVNKELPPQGTYIIDEIHNIAPEISDSLNILMDQNKYHIIGCTTNPGKLPAAFRSRFRQINLGAYKVEDISKIIRGALNRRNISSSSAAITDIAKRSRNNPRTGLNYMEFALDLMTVKNLGSVTIGLLKEAFNELEVDPYGLTPRDYAYLKALPTDRAVGLNHLSAKISVDPETIEQEIEPFLLQLGLVDRTSRGRIRVEK